MPRMSTLRRIPHAHLASRISQAIMRDARRAGVLHLFRLSWPFNPFRVDYILRSLVLRKLVVVRAYTRALEDSLALHARCNIIVALSLFFFHR